MADQLRQGLAIAHLLRMIGTGQFGELFWMLCRAPAEAGQSITFQLAPGRTQVRIGADVDALGAFDCHGMVATRLRTFTARAAFPVRSEEQSGNRDSAHYAQLFACQLGADLSRRVVHAQLVAA